MIKQRKHSAQLCLEDTVQQIGRDASLLTEFAFELRKQDVNDVYSFDFLNGQIWPEVLIDIIMANKWSEEDEQMHVNPERNFKIKMGTKGLLQFKQEQHRNQSSGVDRVHCADRVTSKYTDKVQFKLCLDGFQIVNGVRSIFNEKKDQVVPGKWQKAMIGELFEDE